MSVFLIRNPVQPIGRELLFTRKRVKLTMEGQSIQRQLKGVILTWQESQLITKGISTHSMYNYRQLRVFIITETARNLSIVTNQCPKQTLTSQRNPISLSKITCTKATNAESRTCIYQTKSEVWHCMYTQIIWLPRTHFLSNMNVNL